jgi:hypothetical protein
MSRRGPNWPSEAGGSASKSPTKPTSAAIDDILPTAEHFKQELERITDNDAIQEALAFCKDLFEREEQRAAAFESKATTLMGFGVLAAAFGYGFAALLLDEATAPCTSVVQVLAPAYGMLVLSFFAAIVCALVALWPQEIMAPSPEDILKLAQQNHDLVGVRRERAGEFYKSYLANRRTTNRKGSWVMGAEISVFFGMVFLSIIACVLAVHLILS